MVRKQIESSMRVCLQKSGLDNGPIAASRRCDRGGVACQRIAPPEFGHYHIHFVVVTVVQILHALGAVRYIDPHQLAPISTRAATFEQTKLIHGAETH